METIILK